MGDDFGEPKYVARHVPIDSAIKELHFYPARLRTLYKLNDFASALSEAGVQVIQRLWRLQGKPDPDARRRFVEDKALQRTESTVEAAELEVLQFRDRQLKESLASLASLLLGEKNVRVLILLVEDSLRASDPQNADRPMGDQWNDLGLDGWAECLYGLYLTNRRAIEKAPFVQEMLAAKAPVASPPEGTASQPDATASATPTESEKVAA